MWNCTLTRPGLCFEVLLAFESLLWGDYHRNRWREGLGFGCGQQCNVPWPGQGNLRYLSYPGICQLPVWRGPSCSVWFGGVAVTGPSGYQVLCQTGSGGQLGCRQTRVGEFVGSPPSLFPLRHTPDVGFHLRTGCQGIFGSVSNVFLPNTSLLFCVWGLL